LKRLAVLFGLAGFLVATVLGLLWNYLASHTSVNPTKVPLLGAAIEWLWPTSVMLMAWHSDGWLKAFIGLMLSATANALGYSIVGIILGVVVRWARH
jgi:hypothetical protein